MSNHRTQHGIATSRALDLDIVHVPAWRCRRREAGVQLEVQRHNVAKVRHAEKKNIRLGWWV